MARDRSKTIESLRRLAERPGTPAEGEVARRLLEQMGVIHWTVRPYDLSVFKTGMRIYYCYWCYENSPATVCKQPPKMIQGNWWMRFKFDHLKQPRWVPVTSPLGCHIGFEPFTGDYAETMYRRDLDWKQHDREFAEKIWRTCGIVMPERRDIKPPVEELVS